MKPALACTAILSLLLLMTALAGCTCGFDCSSDDDGEDGGEALLTLGFSDALPEDLARVVLEVTRITLRRADGGEEIVDTFTIDELGVVDRPSFQVDLLEFGGTSQLQVVTELALPPGRISSIVLDVDDGDLNTSSVEEATTGTVRPLRVPGSALELDGLTLAAGPQSWTVEFELARALRFREEPMDYLLTTEGMRVVDSGTSASLIGTVDPVLFDLEAPCDEKTDPQAGNRLYLYRGTQLDPADLADVFNASSTDEIPAGAIAPFAVGRIVRSRTTGLWEYAFGFLPAGDYTLAMACDAAGDDPDNFDAVTVPLPADQLQEFSLAQGASVLCDLAPGARC